MTRRYATAKRTRADRKRDAAAWLGQHPEPRSVTAEQLAQACFITLGEAREIVAPWHTA